MPLMAWVISFLSLDRLDIALFYGVEDLGEGAQLLDRQIGPDLFLGHGRELQADQDAAGQTRTHQTHLFQLTHRMRSKNR